MLLKQSGRRGFTLVELLVVISIIGMLMALTTTYAFRAMKTARETKVSVEITQLVEAVQSYKADNTQYPPAMAYANVNNGKIAFMRHLATAYTNANYGVTLTAFMNVTNSCMATQSSTSRWGYNYLSNGSVTPLNLNYLDQAEALVFWLGGFPVPYNGTMPIAGRKLFGFNADDDNPLKRDLAAIEQMGDPMRFRTPPRFNFDQTRLVDQDADGWLEYVPQPLTGGGTFPPYVYFDSDTYTLSSNSSSGSSMSGMGGIQHIGYPRPTDPMFSTLALSWGVAAPLANYFDSTGQSPIRWQAQDTFQIICSGLDAAYSEPYTNYTSDPTQSLRIPVAPSGQLYTAASNYSTNVGYSAQELDNLTSLSPKTLDNWRNENSQ